MCTVKLYSNYIINYSFREAGKFGYSSNDICVLADIDMTVRDGTMGGITADMSRWPSKENIVSY